MRCDARYVSDIIRTDATALRHNNNNDNGNGAEDNVAHLLFLAWPTIAECPYNISTM